MFRPAVIHARPSSSGTGIKVSLRGSGKSPAKLAIVVSIPVAANLSWVDGDKLEVMLGEKDHHGLIRIRKNNSVGTAIAKKSGSGVKQYFSISLGHQPLYVDRPETSRWCQFVGVDGWLEIALPKWAMETASSVREGPAIDLRVPQVRARPAGAVTSSLMGDPDPSRSALAQRGAK